MRGSPNYDWIVTIPDMNPKESLIQSLIDEGYLRTSRITEAFRSVDRADFVLSEYKDEAYGNYPLPIGEGQTISQPLTVAFMLELLDPKPGEKILDIGAGSGWQTTLLAETVGPNGQIIALERIPELCRFAQKNLEKYDLIKNGRVEFYCRDAAAEIPDGPYDKIIAAAAASKDIPEIWREKLKIGGKIVAPVGGSIWLFTKKSAAEWEEKEFPGFAFVPLIKDEGRKTKDESPKLQKKILGMALVFSLLFLVLVANEIYRPHTAFSDSKSVEVPAGLGSRKIAELLKKEGVIRSKWTFVIYVSLKGQATSLKPGTYAFGRYTIPEIVRDLVQGGPSERTITIPEGWSLKDIGEYFEKENIFSGADFRTAAKSQKWQEEFDFLKDKPTISSLEGYLFPDTYRIFQNADAEEVIIKMLNNFGRKLSSELRAEISRQQKTIFEIVIMASLIEKEVSSDEDRALVSGVLWKRLEKGIGLQVDATITYILAQRQKTKDQSGRISIEDTKIDSPYNTYKYRGLPKGPIANPGLSAIKAAIYPKDSPYLYYLSAPDGRTIFSKTLDEHNLAKAKYLTK